jgi:hypothetical protein
MAGSMYLNPAEFSAYTYMAICSLKSFFQRKRQLGNRIFRDVAACMIFIFPHEKRLNREKIKIKPRTLLFINDLIRIDVAV